MSRISFFVSFNSTRRLLLLKQFKPDNGYRYFTRGMGPTTDLYRTGSPQTLSRYLTTVVNTNGFRTMSTFSKSQASEEDVLGKESGSGDDAKTFKQNNEQPTGKSEKLEFQAETKMLLEIVAKSLYSEQEIFIRELISNASDALEKFRYTSATTGADLESLDRLLDINISTDKTGRTIMIQDSGIGMTKEELISNLGTIARSGSKAFLESIKKNQEGGAGPNTIIGKFGVGFYSCFMVANKVDVYSRSGNTGSIGYKWSSDGTGSYEIQEAMNVKGGTKIIIHLKPECRQFSLEETVREVIKKYSNFVGSPILLNGNQINTVGALWLKDPKTVEPNVHNDFYRFISGSADVPRFTLHFITDVPLSIRCLLYVPDSAPGMFESSANADVGVSLYSRKVLIKTKADNIIPIWLRFLKGVVDSEDIPLNLSRELLQEGTLIKKVKRVVVNRVLRFLQEMAKKQPEKFAKFYEDYGFFLMEGIMLEHDQLIKEEIGKLLRFETSMQPSGHHVSLPEYIDTHKSSEKKIFYLCAPSRTLAESSPYLDSFKSNNIEVLFCFNQHDEMVLNQLGQFDGRKFSCIETEMWLTKDKVDNDLLVTSGLSKQEAESLSSWFEKTLKGQAASISFTQKLESHPCVVTVRDMAAARHFLKLQKAKIPTDTLMTILQPRLEVNPKHPIVKRLLTMKDSDSELAKSVADHLFKNAMVEAGLDLDTRGALAQANSLLLKTLNLNDSSSSRS